MYDVTYVYDDVTYAYDDVTYVYDERLEHSVDSSRPTTCTCVSGKDQ